MCIALLAIYYLTYKIVDNVIAFLLKLSHQPQKHIKSVPCVTFHQPLWLKATRKMLPIVCVLEGFHNLMGFLGSMGTMMKCHGLAESFETVYVSTVR